MASTYPNLIDGQAVATKDCTADINPSNVTDVVGEFARGGAADAQQAIASARTAFKKWARANSPTTSVTFEGLMSAVQSFVATA